MFGPNASSSINCNVDYHHREEKFSVIYRDVLTLLRAKFEIPQNYEIIVYTGSGTLAVEAFIASFKGSLRVDSLDTETEKFANRWTQLVRHYGKYNENSDHSIKVLFETSRSQYNGDLNATFVDAVSGFPFWKAPASPAWVTVSSKMLGSVPVLGILVMDRDFIGRFIEDTPSYLNPIKYLNHQKVWETPFTPAMPLFQDFREKLRSFDVGALRRQVATNFDLLTPLIGEENLINADLSPVLTVRAGGIPQQVIERYCLYGKTAGGNIQIFLYSESAEKYAMLAEDIKRAKSRLCSKVQRHAQERKSELSQ